MSMTLPDPETAIERSHTRLIRGKPASLDESIVLGIEGGYHIVDGITAEIERLDPEDAADCERSAQLVALADRVMEMLEYMHTSLAQRIAVREQWAEEGVPAAEIERYEHAEHQAWMRLAPQRANFTSRFRRGLVEAAPTIDETLRDLHPAITRVLRAHLSEPHRRLARAARHSTRHPRARLRTRVCTARRRSPARRARPKPSGTASDGEPAPALRRRSRGPPCGRDDARLSSRRARRKARPAELEAPSVA